MPAADAVAVQEKALGVFDELDATGREEPNWVSFHALVDCAAAGPRSSPVRKLALSRLFDRSDAAIQALEPVGPYQTWTYRALKAGARASNDRGVIARIEDFLQRHPLPADAERTFTRSAARERRSVRRAAEREKVAKKEHEANAPWWAKK